MARKLFIFLVVFLLSLSFLMGCRQQEPPVYSGTIEGIQISIQSELGGPIKEISCAEGDEIKKGQILLTLDERTYALQLEEAKAGVAAAQAQYNKIGGDYQKALLNQARARQNLLQVQLEKTQITSPVDGIVLHRHVEIGEIVKPGTTVFTLMKKGEMEVVVYVPEANLNQVKIGQTATIKVDAYPDQTFKGKITHISNKAEFTPKNVQTPEERTKMVFAVTVKITEGIDQLKPGMPADVTFSSPPATEGK